MNEGIPIWVYIVVACIFVALALYYYFKDKRQPKMAMEDLPSVKGAGVPSAKNILARIYDRGERRIYNQMLTYDKKTMPEGLGRKWNRNGKWVYALVKQPDEELYYPVMVTQTMEDPPSRLFRAIKHPQVALIYGVKEKKGFFDKYWPFLLVAGAILFAMWTTVAK